MTTADFDRILDELGHFGRYQLINYLLLFIPLFFTSAFVLTFAFAAGEPDYRCLVPECENGLGPYSPTWLKNAVPFGEDGRPSLCTRYAVSTGASDWVNGTCPADGFLKNVTHHCNDLIFRGEMVTIVNTFNLTCVNNKWKLTLIGTMNFLGQFFGLPLAGAMSDRFGRRTVLVSAIIGQSICGIAKALAPSYLFYITLEFMETLIGGGLFPTLFVLALELVGPSRRTIGGVSINVIYAFGTAYLALLAWALPYWRHMLFAVYAPTLIFILYLWLIPESVRWLMSRGRFEDASSVVHKAATRNGVQLSNVALSMFKSSSDSNGTPQTERVESSDDIPDGFQFKLIKEMLTSKILVIRLLVNFVCWISCTVVYYGLSLGSVTLSGDKYMNFAVTALVEAPGNIIVWPMMEWVGRRKTLSATLILAGILCIVVPFLSHDEELQWLVTTSFMLGKIFITGSFNVLYTYSSEMFPTGLRSSSLAACSTFGRIGSMLAPQAPLLAVYGASLPYIVFGAMALIAGFSSLILPETLNQNLPDTVKEAEELSWRNTKKKKFLPNYKIGYSPATL
ncbi:organic cation transporter protein-like [Ischnura elegans]|uniref:organic cation transporter protein-like n=1 Tax=Ischnura elegans TaxID=197161 RepID=UPI001ED8A2EB|nr:organic cation transporter protein-like [Ischnura elegans]